jgi:hypothetical protein
MDCVTGVGVWRYRENGDGLSAREAHGDTGKRKWTGLRGVYICNDSTSQNDPCLVSGSVRSSPTGVSDWTGLQTGSLGLDVLGLDQSKEATSDQFKLVT